MAQVMVNFRLDEEIKKSMEQACREMGLSMTTAFTIFAKKVGSEKRIPFEITAESRRPDSRREQGEDQLLLVRKQERLELLCAAIRRSLTAIHTGIPASITGLSMERAGTSSRIRRQGLPAPPKTYSLAGAGNPWPPRT